MKLTFQEHSLLAGLYIVDGRSTYKRTEVAMPNFDRELVPLLLSLQTRGLVQIVQQTSLGNQPGNGRRGRVVEITAELTDAGREALRPGR